MRVTRWLRELAAAACLGVGRVLGALEQRVVLPGVRQAPTRRDTALNRS